MCVCVWGGVCGGQCRLLLTAIVATRYQHYLPIDHRYWHWKVLGLDGHFNPIYDPAGPQTLFNDPVVEARHLFNASTDKATCDVCKGAAIHCFILMIFN